MATRRRKRERRASADLKNLNRPLTVRLLRPLPAPARFSQSPRQAVEDRRSHHPLGFFRPARQWSGHPVKPHVVSKPTRHRAQLPFGLRFAVPQKTLICVRRKTRKEVLHALHKVGKGRSGFRKKRSRNFYSRISC